MPPAPPLDALVADNIVKGRAAISALPLTCENTNTALPYIDPSTDPRILHRPQQPGRQRRLRHGRCDDRRSDGRAAAHPAERLQRHPQEGGLSPHPALRPLGRNRARLSQLLQDALGAGAGRPASDRPLGVVHRRKCLSLLPGADLRGGAGARPAECGVLTVLDPQPDAVGRSGTTSTATPTRTPR